MREGWQGYDEIIMELDRLLGERSESYNIQEEMEGAVMEEEVDGLTV